MTIKVKSLVWEIEEDGWWVSAPDAFFRRLGYEVRITDNGGVRARTCNEPFKDFDGTADQAKAAAQADYESRILSAIETTPALVIELSEDAKAQLTEINNAIRRGSDIGKMIVGDAPVSEITDEMVELPVNLGWDTLNGMANYFGYTLEEMAEMYGEIIRRASLKE